MSDEKRPGDDVARLVDAVHQSAKYRHVCRDVVRAVGERELAKGRRWKEAVKAAKKKLHQIGGAYLMGGMDYADWLKMLRASAGDSPAFRQACVQIMAHHASTRERLGILDSFYATVLADLFPVRSVLDIACGLNPLAIPWMGLSAGTAYYAYDIYEDMVDFLQSFFDLTHVTGQVQARDVLQTVPKHKVDLALLLKSIPCLEQVDKAAVERLLDRIEADFLLISFPVHSLGGRERGMSINYATRFDELIAGRCWSVKRFQFETELVFLVKT